MPSRYKDMQWSYLMKLWYLSVYNLEVENKRAITPKKKKNEGEKYTKTVNEKEGQKIQTWSTWHDILIFNDSKGIHNVAPQKKISHA